LGYSKAFFLLQKKKPMGTQKLLCNFGVPSVKDRLAKRKAFTENPWEKKKTIGKPFGKIQMERGSITEKCFNKLLTRREL